MEGTTRRLAVVLKAPSAVSVDDPDRSGKKDLEPRYSDPFSALKAEMDPDDHQEDANGRLHLRQGVDHSDDHAARQLQKARWLWSRREPLQGSPAEVYLREVRGYDGVLPATLGFLPPFKPAHHPALTAAFGIPDCIELSGLERLEVEQVHGLHLTLLKSDGSGKAGNGRDKFMVGPSMGWPIVIAPANHLLGLAVTEGIEDALSVHQATGLGVWAAGSAGRMPALADKMPEYIEAVTIYAHDDETGQLGAHKLADALVGRGIEVFVEGSGNEGIQRHQ